MNYRIHVTLSHVYNATLDYLEQNCIFPSKNKPISFLPLPFPLLFPAVRLKGFLFSLHIESFAQRDVSLEM